MDVTKIPTIYLKTMSIIKFFFQKKNLFKLSFTLPNNCVLLVQCALSIC